MNRFVIVLFSALSIVAAAQHVPSFEEVISLRNAGSVVLSPDGKMIAFTVQTTDWTDNRFDSEIWLKKEGQKPFQLTNTTKNSSSNPLFSPDGQWLAFLADRGNKNQIHIINLAGGEARVMTKIEEGVSNFEWHPSGTKFIFIKPEKEDKKEREKRYGGYESDDKEFTLSHLWQVDFKPEMPDPSERPCYESSDSLKMKAGCIDFPKAQRLTDGKFTVTNFFISPDGKQIAFTHQPDPLINSFLRSDISVFDFSSGKVTPVVANASSDALEDWSPDSKEILYTTNLSDSTSNFYTNSKLMSVNVETKATRELAKELDEDLGGFTWEQTGIYASIWNKTTRPVYRIDPKTGAHSVWLNSPDQIFGISFSKGGDRIAFVGRNGDQLNEIFISDVASPKPEKISDLTNQIKDWKVAQSEVISWR